MKKFENKTVLITGAQRGIGFEIARKFAMEGANLVMTDINEEKISESARLISDEFNVKALGLSHDVSKEKSCEEVISKTIETFFRVDVLVNNAGITRDNLIIRMAEKDFDDVISINLKGPFLMSKLVFKYMSKQRYGKIVNISSVVGQAGQAGQSNYASSKAGLIGLTKSLAKEFARRNINVNAVAPGFIETKMTNNLDEKNKEEIIKQIPLERFGQPQDVANAVLFLSHDESSYITGQVIAVNGGIYI